MADLKAVTQLVMVMRSAGLRWAPPLATPEDIEVTTRTYHEILSDSDSEDVMTALKDLMRSSKDWVTPSELVQRIREISQRRVAKLPLASGPMITEEERAKVLDKIMATAAALRPGAAK